MTYLSAVLADNPLHYWRCADPGGSIVHDIGSSPDALLMAGQYQEPLPYIGPNSDGGSILLNGITGPWDLDGEALNNPFTVECWVWQQERTPATQYCILANLAAGGVLAALYLNNGVPNLQGFGAPRATAVAAISKQHWHHLVGTVDALGNGLLYVDAVVQPGAVVGAGGAGSYTKAIGLVSPGGTNVLSGALSECAMYSAVLTPTQVNNHFVAADNTISRPIYKANGTWSITTGSLTSNAQQLAVVLGDLSTTYLNNP